MNEDLVKIENFKKFLNELQINTTKVNANISDSIEQIKNLSAKPIDRAQYDYYFNSFSVNNLNETAYISKLTETKEKIDDIIDGINNNSAQRNELKKIVNNKQFRSGLEGLSRQYITDNVPMSEIEQYPEKMRDLVKGPYVDTPYRRKGGKSKKKRQIKSKKRRSLHK